MAPQYLNPLFPAYSRALIVLQQWGSFTVISNNRLSPEANLLPEDAGYSNDKRAQEERRHDGEGKDPLECNNLSEELADPDGSR